MQKPVTLLALETSCDETGVAVLRRVGDTIKVLSSEVASQVDVHKLTGGVVPEVAAREHASIIQPLINKVLTEAKVINTPLDKGGLGGVAVTVGPGLVPALSIGVTAAQTLAFAWRKPIIPVHHLEGHIYSALLQSAENPNFKIQNSKLFPALALIVSGGHTMLVKMNDHLKYQVIGSTRDDAVGEAFDKVARLLGLPYPGGPALSRLAEQGNPAAFTFSRPMLHSGDLDFSFSGIKTEVLYKLRDLQQQRVARREDPARGTLSTKCGCGRRAGRAPAATGPAAKNEANDFVPDGLKKDISASFQQAVVETLVAKTKEALRLASLAQGQQYQTVLLAGGVAANQLLRQQMQSMADKLNIPLRIAPPELCGDNAVMIGQAALFAYQKNRPSSWRDIDAHARLNLEQHCGAN